MVDDGTAVPDHAVILPLGKMADVVEVPYSTLRRWAASGWISPATEPDGKVLIDERDARSSLIYVCECDDLRAVLRWRTSGRRN